MLNDGTATLHRGSVDHRGVRTRPIKYKKPPVWALVWNGRNNKIHDTSLSEIRPEMHPDLDSGSSAQVENAPYSIGPGGNPSLTGLGPSLSGVLPKDDIASYIAGWAFGLISELSNEERKHVELEFKFGKLLSRQGKARLMLPVSTEAVVDPSYARNSTSFHSEVEETVFKHLEGLLDGLGGPAVPQDLSRTENVGRDEIHSGDIRVSYDGNNNVIAVIHKQRLGDLFLVQPQSAIDMRVTLSVEHPENLPEPLGPAHHTRHKSRLSWTTDGLRVDLTAVQTGNSRTKEAEVEVDSRRLISTYDEHLKGSQDGLDKFLEVVRFALDSCRFLTRQFGP